MKTVEYLVGVDFSPSSRRALRLARDLASKTGARVCVVHVVAPVQQVEGIDAADFAAERKRWAERRLRALGRHGITVIVSVGDPAEELVTLARKRRSELLVLGARHRSSLQRWLLGSVSSRVLPQSPCPVLIVPEA